jgi:hypothetical protein
VARLRVLRRWCIGKFSLELGKQVAGSIFYISHEKRAYAIDFAIAGQGAANCDIAIWLLVIFIYKNSQ